AGDDVALGRPSLRIPAKAPAVLPRALRTAMDQVCERPFLVRIETGRLQNPHLHRIAVSALHRHGFRPLTIEFVQYCLVVKCPNRIKLGRSGEANLRGMVHCRFGECEDLTVLARRQTAVHLAADKLLDLAALQVDLKDGYAALIVS